MITNSKLHYTIIKYIIDKGYAPDVKTLSNLLSSSEKGVEESLLNLHEYHGVVLHPNQLKIWVVHPFSVAPTNFIVKSAKGEWWGNCAWCSLGIATLLKEDVTITTSFGAHGEPVKIHIINGEVEEKDLYVHFPIPMKNAWDNVIYTCSTMLIFHNELEIDDWCLKHRIQKGDVQPIENIWEFSKEWYGNHLNPKWEKWTTEQAVEIFKKFNLTGAIWEIPVSKDRF